jgi:hypothetical protein
MVLIQAEKSGIRLSNLWSEEPTPLGHELSSLTSESTSGTPATALTSESTHQEDNNASTVDTSRTSSRNESPSRFLDKVKHPTRFLRKRKILAASSSSIDQTSTQTISTTSDLRNGMTIEALERMSISPLSMQQNQSRLVQSQTSRWAHIKWAHHNMDLFKAKIEDIRNAIADLQNLLAFQDPKQPENLLALASSVDLEEYSSERLRNALGRLHSALKALNSVSKESACSFAVHVAARPANAWKEIKHETSLPLGDDGFLFYVQAQHLQANPRDSNFVMVETTKDGVIDSSQQPREGFASLQCLDDLLQTVSDEGQAQYIPLGFISTPRSQSDRHYVFLETKQWRQVKTLADILDETITPNGITHLDLIDLAEIILTAHLDFTEVRETTPNPRVESFIYFQEPAIQGETDNSQPIPESTLLLPYISNSFGQKRRHGRPGATGRAYEKDSNAAIIELGLILFQLGSHRKISYLPYTLGNLPASLLKARGDAKKDLNLVEKNHGPGFATVVEVCLSASGLNEKSAVAGCLALLKGLRQDLNRDKIEI